ncbi:hydrogenase maturation protease [Gloeothece verrucosa]|uniref:Hydrogenase maturation protease n=1 Tax=Gloeothece verrucosa (strain PCC 7822) TaxID=497965 RepID=E0U7G4_GLOV7|nr:hydrogenase maturation protease [Gloeothece verrucosa]ADN13660.1 hydrogenase maturation protease [Gloeothece verrucosa PCC 7822]
MLTIIGCGNVTRNDDAVGVIVVQRLGQFLQENPYQNVRAFDCGTAGMEVMFQARGSKQLIIVDACSTGSQPGTIFKVPGSELEALPEPSYSLHDFRWDHALYSGKKIFQEDFPQDVTVYLIEAENLDFGLELSSTVEFAAEQVLQMLQDLIKHNYSFN